MKLLIFLLLISFNSLSIELDLGLATKHINGRNPNENNQLVGISFNSYKAGTFINSYSARSVYAVKEFNLFGAFSANAGMVSGYDPKCMTGEIVNCRVDLIIPVVALSWNPYKNIEIIQMANAFMLILKIPLHM